MLRKNIWFKAMKIRVFFTCLSVALSFSLHNFSMEYRVCFDNKKAAIDRLERISLSSFTPKKFIKFKNSWKDLKRAVANDTNELDCYDAGDKVTQIISRVRGVNCQLRATLEDRKRWARVPVFASMRPLVPIFFTCSIIEKMINKHALYNGLVGAVSTSLILWGITYLTIHTYEQLKIPRAHKFYSTINNELNNIEAAAHSWKDPGGDSGAS